MKVPPTPFGLLAAALLLTLGIAAPAGAQSNRDLQRAKAEAGLLDDADGTTRTPAGTLRVQRPELIAARFGQKIRFELELARDVEQGTLRVGIPRRWRATPASGLDTTRPPRIARRAAGVKLVGSRSALVLDLSGARSGDTVVAEIADLGIPAGGYRLPVSYAEGSRRARPLDDLEVRLIAPVREKEDPDNEWDGVRAINVTDDSSAESETFVTVVPGNPQRIIAGVNGGGGYNAWITDNGGATWTKRAVPTTADVAGSTTNVTLSTCCDPMSAADAAGNIWYGGLASGAGSRIHVSRIAAGTNTFVNTVGLQARTTGTQDKPMMTIDNSPSSPTYGRLYVVWNEPNNSGLNIVVSHCDTRPGGTLSAAACDNADNWTAPVSVTKATGSVIYADVAVGHDGKVYVVWWDFSSANAVKGAVCVPSTTACNTTAGWSSARTIAIMDATGGAPLPFACPIVAQPGGRASTSPQVETDISSAASRGTVYVTWSDLRTGSGSTRCADGLVPAATHLTFDSFVTAASNALPGGASPSPQVARRLLTDGDGGGQSNSDDWFPWLAVDQTSGVAYADFYSTRDDATRKTTHFYVRSVSPALELGPLTKVSTAPSDYSGAACCGFGNDYGDYTGIDATMGSVIPIWSDMSGPDGEALIDIVSPPAPGPAPMLVAGAIATSDATPGGDGDGTAEPGETLTVGIPVDNDGTAEATGALGTLTSTRQDVTFPDGSASYGSIAPGSTAHPDNPYKVKLGKDIACGSSVPLTLTVTHDAGAVAKSYGIDTGTASIDGGTGLPVGIPDANSSGVNHSITLPAGSGTVTDLDVALSITHPYVSDLTVKLTHGGVTVLLVQKRGGGGDNFTGTIFDDEAAASITSGGAPFSGRFRPEQALSAFDGMPLEGTWTLNVTDTATADIGTVDAWSLRRSACAVPPRAALGAPSSATVGQPVQLDASGSEDLDGTIANYAWDLDDNGSFERDSGQGAAVEHTFGSPGSHEVHVRVTDDSGHTGTAARIVEVLDAPANQAPVVTMGGPTSTKVGRVEQFTAAASDADGTIQKYEWDVDGDATNGSDGFEHSTGTTAAYSAAIAAPTGTRTVRVRVTDDDGGASTASRSLSVTENALPTAQLSGPGTADTGQAVAFDASGSGDSDGSIAEYRWDLDDDGTFETNSGADATQEKTFTTNGTKTVRVKVVDDDGATSTPASEQVVVNALPTAAITGPESTKTGREIQLSGADSSDPEGAIARYEWDLDGAGGFEVDTGTTPTVTTTFASAGSKTVRLRVTDGSAATGTASKSVTVNANVAPSAAISGPSGAAVGESVAFDAAGSTDSDGSVQSYEWDLDGNGSFETATAGGASASTSFAQAGTYTVSVRVTDDDGATDDASRDVTVAAPPANAAPSAAITGPSGATVGQSVTFDASASSDPDGTIEAYEWDLDGNGSFETATAGVPAASTSFAAAGTYTVSVRATDDDGAGATASMAIGVTDTGTGTGTGTGTDTGAGSGTGTGTGTETGTGTGTSPPPVVSLAKPGARVKVKRGRFALALTGCANCNGTLRLHSTKKLRAKPRAKAKKVRLAIGAFHLGPTGTTTVDLKLSKRNQALLRRLRRIPLTVGFVVTSPAGQTAAASGRITLSR